MTEQTTPSGDGRGERSRILGPEEIRRSLRRIAHEILESGHGAEDLVLLGIPHRGVPLAERLAAQILEAEGLGRPLEDLAGSLDITMYRDDLRANPTRSVGRTILPCDLDDRTVVLVDDVLFSGRTVQAALHALADLGRPRAIQLVTLIDRGHRELPIQADIVGKSIPTAGSERVRVHLTETDGEDLVSIERSA